MTSSHLRHLRHLRQPRRLRRPHRAALPTLVCVAALLLAGCGEEEPLPQDSADSSLRAGAPDALEAAGVDVVSLEQPAAPGVRDVGRALRDAGVGADLLDPAEPGVADVLELDPARLVGGPDLVGDLGDVASASDQRYVAVVFTDPEDAWVYAESQPTVFADEAAESDRTAYVAGPVVAFVAGDADADLGDDVRRALADLAGVGDASASSAGS